MLFLKERCEPISVMSFLHLSNLSATKTFKRTTHFKSVVNVRAFEYLDYKKTVLNSMTFLLKHQGQSNIVITSGKTSLYYIIINFGNNP